MKVLFISNDPSIFDATSASRARMRAYARVMALPAEAAGKGRGELHIVSAAPHGAREEVEESLHVHPVHGSRITRLVALGRRARALVRGAGIEVVSAQDPFEHGLVARAAIFGTKAVLHVQLHTDPFARDFARASLLNRVRLLIMPFVLARSARVRVVSEPLQQELIRRYRFQAPVSVLPIYIDLAPFRAVRRSPEKGNLLWVGRLEREKCPLLALEALAAVRASGIEAHLTLLGTGRLKKAIWARAKVRGLVDFVRLPGFADPAPYLAKAELVLATSLYEGYGLSIIEALASGVPVVSTDVGVAREAGAIIANRTEYARRVAELLKAGPPAPPHVKDPYPSFEAYVTAFANDLRACLESK